MKTWELIEADEIDCTMDNSGIYTVIHRRKGTETHKQYQDSRVFVRCDIMLAGKIIDRGVSAVHIADEPLVSFQGLEDNVRKQVIRWMGENGYTISAEHGSYIGRELFRAVHDFHYIQD